MNTSSVFYALELPSIDEMKRQSGLFGELPLFLIYDKVLSSYENFNSWSSHFTQSYEVEGGEKLKSIKLFPEHLEKIINLFPNISRKNTAIVSAGGGSVGDFSGFTASILKRGIPLIHIPTTWLAAMDSAHGGKTALNVGDMKNQVGSFYPPRSVFIVKSVLENLPEVELNSAVGEFVKMALLEGEDFFNAVEKVKKFNSNLLWEYLPMAVDSKYKIVEQDPTEDTGFRQILNLGHTFGHIVEGSYGVSHGLAVSMGLYFCLEWSRSLNLIKSEEAQRIEKVFSRHFCEKEKIIPKKLNRDKVIELVSGDKKLESNNKVQFVFLEGIGRPIRQLVTLDDFVDEVYRQGWC